MSRPMYAPDHATIATPVGMVTICGDERWITAIRIERFDPTTPISNGHGVAVQAAAKQLTAWFAGRLATFDIPLAPAATARGAALRAGMIAIPYGSTISYGELARINGSSARAIGQACARNPFPIIVPCHRVTNADGSLGAYSAGDGPQTKRLLLDLEDRSPHPF